MFNGHKQFNGEREKKKDSSYNKVSFDAIKIKRKKHNLHKNI